MNLRALLALLFLSVGGVACRAERELPALGTVPELALTDQASRPFTRDNVRGKVWIAAFMFTRCPTICPRITKQMREIQAVAEAKGLALHLVSFSVDPEYDTPGVLHAYAERHGANNRRWSFVTGEHEALRRTAVEGFKLAMEGKAREGAAHYGITHGSHLVLVDRNLVIRGYYRSSDDVEVKRLLLDAERLLEAR